GAAERVGVVGQVSQAVHVHVGGDRQEQARGTVPGGDDLQVVLVLREVGLVRVGEPGGDVGVQVAACDAGVGRSHVQRGQVDLVALLLQEHLPEVGGGDGVRPSRDVDDLDRPASGGRRLRGLRGARAGGSAGRGGVTAVTVAVVVVV